MASPHDVICFIKQHLCDEQLSQEPLLVLTHARAQRFDVVTSRKILDHGLEVFSLGY